MLEKILILRGTRCRKGIQQIREQASRLSFWKDPKSMLRSIRFRHIQLERSSNRSSSDSEHQPWRKQEPIAWNTWNN